MIREPTFKDMPRLQELFEQLLAESYYADLMKADIPVLRSLIMDGVRKNNGKHCGGFLFLVDEHNGEIEGFIFAVLERVYHFGDKLRASDVFLYCTDKARPRAWNRLIDRYTEWAEENPKVIEIMLSWTDAVSPKVERIEKAYSRKGFRKCGGIWTRRTGA